MALYEKNKYFKEFVERNAKNVIISNKRLQSYLTSSCGQFVCVFMYYKSQGYTLDDFLSKFKLNVLRNELKVKRLFRKIFKNKKTQSGTGHDYTNLCNNDGDHTQMINQYCTSYVNI